MLSQHKLMIESESILKVMLHPHLLTIFSQNPVHFAP